MMTIERIFGPEALQELRSIPMSPLESEIHDLMFSVYGESLTIKPVTYDLLPACYRKIQVNA